MELNRLPRPMRAVPEGFDPLMCVAGNQGGGLDVGLGFFLAAVTAAIARPEGITIGHGGIARLRRKEENQKAKGKNQKAKISDTDFGPGWGGIIAGWPQSKQSSMTQFRSGAGNWPSRGIFAARKEMEL